MKGVWRFLLLNATLALGLVLLGIACGISAHFFWFAGDFTIASTELVCEKPLNNRCETHYRAVRRDNSTLDFVPLGYEFPKGELQVGHRLEKERFSLSYRINGVDRRWQYGPAMLARFMAGVAFLLLYAVLRVRLTK